MSFSSSATARIFDSMFEDAYATGVGGSIHIGNANVEIVRTTFERSTCGTSGSVVSINDGSTVLFDQCILREAEGLSGAIYVSGTGDGTFVNVSRSTITNCKGPTFGGGVYARGEMFIQDSTFENNEAVGVDGADIYSASSNTIPALRSDGLVLVKSCDGLELSDVSDALVGTCADAEVTSNYCMPAACDDVAVGIDCFCLLDGLVRTTEPLPAGCMSSGKLYLDVPSSGTLTMRALKPESASQEMVLSNAGSQPFDWALTTSFAQDFIVSPTAGSLAAGELIKLTAVFASARTQARAASCVEREHRDYRSRLTRFVSPNHRYVGNITISALSGVCKCRSQQLDVAVKIDVSAEAHANNSQFSLSNGGEISAYGELAFTVNPADLTGMPIKDASNIAFNAELLHPTSSGRRRLQAGSTTCSVSYTTAGHGGACKLPTLTTGERIAGDFTLVVFDMASKLVGGSGTVVRVESCPEGYFFHSPNAECKACPKGALCPGGKVLPIPEKGYWSELKGYADLGKVYECVHRENCRGGTGYSSACWESQATVDACEIDLCSFDRTEVRRRSVLRHFDVNLILPRRSVR